MKLHNRIKTVRLVWVVFSLILFSIIGIHESFAEQASGKSAWVTNSDKVCGEDSVLKFIIVKEKHCG